MRTVFTKAEIRKFMVLYFGLHERDSFSSGKQGILNYFDRVQSIQSDPLNIIGTNADILLHSRFCEYTPTMLEEMMYQDHTLCDGFDKEAAIYQTKDWSKFSLVREALTAMNLRVLSYRHQEEALTFLQEILSYLEEHETICANDLKKRTSVSTKWGSSNLINAALYHLWCQGEIVISDRSNKRKKYARADTYIPDDIRKEAKLTYEAFLKWYVLRRLQALGITRLKKSSGWQGFYLQDMKLVKEVVASLITSKEVMEISIEGMKEPCYVSSEAYHILETLNTYTLHKNVRFIAPLDNFIWDRKFIKEIFDFEYVWEVYKPIEQRKYGYYVLPVLFEDRFIARIEPSRDPQRSEVLEIKNIWYEDEKYTSLEIQTAIDEAVELFNMQMKRSIDHKKEVR